jgi:hypothetical protein
MEAILPEALVETIGEQWPCRQSQIKQFATLLHVSQTKRVSKAG